MAEEPPIYGRPRSQEKLFWVQAVREARKDALKTVDEAARQIIGLVTLLSGLYFAAISFGQVPKGVPGLRLLFVAPIALWALSLAAAVAVFAPRQRELSPYSPDEAEAAFLDVLRAKRRWFFTALVLLLVSLAVLVVAAWVYLDVYVPR